MKLILVTSLALIALVACGTPANDTSNEIIETSKGVVGKVVVLKTSPTLKSGSLSDAARDWQSAGWGKVSADTCKDVAPADWRNSEAYELTVAGYAADNVPTYKLRICATQVINPKSIAAIGYIISSAKAEAPKP